MLKEYRKRGEELIFKECPYCGNMKWNFQVSIPRGVMHCWVCDAKGPISRLNILLPGVLQEDLGLSNTITSPELEQKPLTLEGYQGVIGTRGQEYLEGRGFSLNDIVTWKVMFKSPNKLVFPLYDNESSLIYYSEKDIDSGKWNLPPGVSKKSIVWARFYNALDFNIILVEGIFDAMRLFSYGYNVMLLLGTIMSQADVEFLKSCKLNPVLFLDGDCGKFTYNKINKMWEGFQFMLCPKDPDDLSKEEVDLLFSSRYKYGLEQSLKMGWSKC